MIATIPQTSPLAGYEARRTEIDDALARVLTSGRYLLGPETEAFEREFAAWVGGGTRECVSTASGTEALHLALRACGVGKGNGDEVITVSHTAVATVAAIELCGARPVLVDIRAEDFNLDPAGLDAALSPRTRAVVPVHLYGQAADLAPVVGFCRRHGLRLVEDCSQAHGATYPHDDGGSGGGEGARKVGTFGDAAVFSFYPTKNLGALGDSGAVVTSEPALAETLRSLRQYGWRRERYVSEEPGWNGRMDELQAAVLRVKLRGLDADNARRAALAAVYAEHLAAALGLRLPAALPGRGHVWHQYVLRHPRRDALAEHLRVAGVGTLVHYPVPIHLQPAYAGRGRLAAGPMPETERAAREVLSLPMFPELTSADAVRVAKAVCAFAADVRGQS